MKIQQLLHADAIYCDVVANSKKTVLQELSRLAATHFNLNESLIYHKLLAREQLGATGVGAGVAIPHCRIDEKIEKSAIFLRLNKKIDFDAVDDQLVDLIVLLITPEQDTVGHLQSLATISRVLRNDGLCQAIRQANGSEEIYALLVGELERAA